MRDDYDSETPNQDDDDVKVLEEIPPAPRGRGEDEIKIQEQRS